MKFVNFIKKCYDKNTREQYARGQVLQFSDKRAKEIIDAGAAKEIVSGGGGGGADGKSAYEIAVENGFIGTEDDWLASLKGEKGDKGDTGEQGADGAKGDKGEQGQPGASGKSAYQIAVDNGFVGTEEEWLESLKGKDGSGAVGTLQEVTTQGNITDKPIITTADATDGYQTTISAKAIDSRDPNRPYNNYWSLSQSNGLQISSNNKEEDVSVRITPKWINIQRYDRETNTQEQFSFMLNLFGCQISMTDKIAEAFRQALGVERPTLQDVFRNSLDEYGQSSCYVDKPGTFYYNFYDGLNLTINSQTEDLKIESLSTEHTITSIFSPGKISFVANESAVDYGYANQANEFTVDVAEGTVKMSDGIKNDFKKALGVDANETAIANCYTKTEMDEKIAEAMTDVDNEHFHPVTELPPVADAKENHEYILIEYEQDGTTIKSETHYLFYGGAYHRKSTGGVSLDGYATEDFVNAKTAKMGEFDVTPIPQGPTGANEINAFLSNKDNEYARLSYVRQQDGTLPSAVRMNIRSGLGEDSFELPTKGYVDSKALTPTGWGVARTGVATVTFNGSKWSSSTAVDVSDLGFSSGADYEVIAQPTTGGTATPWGNAVAFVNANKGASAFSVSSVTMEESLSGTVNVKYTIFAKGYGAVAYTGEIPTGGATGQILTKRSDADGDYGWVPGGGSGTVDTEMSDTSENAVQNKVIKEYVDNIQGLPSGGENGQILARNSMSPSNSEWIDNPIGTHFEVGAEKWYGTYTENGVTYQVYSKLIDIGALPSAAGTTQYPHGITGIKQILQINGFTNDGFVMNASRQNAQDNIAVYQAKKAGDIAIEVGKDRSSKNGFVMLIYAKNNE